MVELYAISVPEKLPPDVFEKLLSYLDEPIQTRIRRFRLEGDAIRSLFGRISVIWYLSSSDFITNSELHRIKFGEEGIGKPIIVEPHLAPRVEYNISHDDQYVLLGVSRGKIGVDLMKIPTNPADIEEALFDQMTISERRGISSSSDTRKRSERLTILWCVKEAYVKAIGEGIGFGMERVEVDLDDRGTLVGVKVDGVPLKETGWDVQVGRLDEEYIWASVAESSERQSNRQSGTIPKTISHQEIIDALQS